MNPRALLVAAALLLTAATPALAVDVVNADDAPYDLVLQQNGETMRLTIGPKMTFTGVCAVCTVQVKTKPSEVVEAEANDTVTIRKGSLAVGG